MFKKKEKLERTLLEKNPPQVRTEEVYRIKVERVTITYKEKRDDHYFEVKTGKEIDWSAWYEKSKEDATANQVLKVSLPNGEYTHTDDAREVFDQTKAHIDISKLAMYLNQI